jgi:two-component system, sensor histidine kinase and response regulator
MKTKILLIEDEDELRFNLEEILEYNGYEFFSASNGIEGLNFLNSVPLDLIISDIMMPIMDGYQLLKIVRANPLWANLPFLFLSAKVRQAETRKGMELGAEDYLCKPIKQTVLLEAIQAALKKKRQREKLILQMGKEAVKWERNVKYHELRTPLTGIMNIIDYMKINPEIDEKQIFFLLGKMEEAGKRLNNSLLKLNRLYDILDEPLEMNLFPSLKELLEIILKRYDSQ